MNERLPKHIRGGWSHYTDTSEPVDSNGAQNMVTIQSGFRTGDLPITGPNAHTNCANQDQRVQIVP
jgi:hypothetical protein